jgi:hypothetical protein
VHYGLWVPNFGPYADLPLLADLAARSEAAGWEGWFLMDHVVHRGGYEPAVDPWMALALAARATDRIRLGPLVTPLPRRRPWNVARQAATLDRLSRGRVLLGLGIGSERTPEFHGLGEETALPRRASMLDEGLELLASMWSGEPVHHQGEHYRVDGLRFQPTPVQKPLPIWWGRCGRIAGRCIELRGGRGCSPLRCPVPHRWPRSDGSSVPRRTSPSKASFRRMSGRRTEPRGGCGGFPAREQISAFESVIDAGPPV